MTRVLVTGAAGFIGASLCERLLSDTDASVVGFDNLNDYYDPKLKHARLHKIESHPRSDSFSFVRGDLVDSAAVTTLFDGHRPDVVVNLAAQAGVRYSIENPRAYIESNVVGFFNILEACRRHQVGHLVYASSSSVYGNSTKVPYTVGDMTDSPVSLYAATKKSNELLAHSYSSLYGFATTGLRFFTVYGPMGRPDMAYFKFADQIVAGQPIDIYNFGDLRRDFTYIDDIVSGVLRIVMDDGTPRVGEHRIYNIGNSRPVSLLEFVDTLELALLAEGVISKRPVHTLLPMQPGDVYQTFADVTDLERDYGFRPETSLATGLASFVRWYRMYNQS